jgi:hypothetical protein
MIASPDVKEELTLSIALENHVRASLEATFEALLEQVGPGFETLDGKSLSLKLEPYPGGRWYRDLGGDNGHFWGHVQAIKRPTLLEITGPLFMSFPVVSNVQYRLAAADGGTLISFRHSALGFIPADMRKDMTRGWNEILTGVARRAEGRHAPA